MKDYDNAITLPVIAKPGRIYIEAAAFFLLGLYLLSTTKYFYEREPISAIIVLFLLSGLIIYWSIHLILLNTLKLRLLPNELQLLRMGKCIESIPASSLHLGCVLTWCSGQFTKLQRLKRSLILSCESLDELAQAQKELMLKNPATALEASVRTAKAGWEREYAARYLIKKIRYKKPIRGIWTTCYPEMVAALKNFYPHLQWEAVSSAEIRDIQIKDTDPLCVVRTNTPRAAVELVPALTGILFAVMAVMLYYDEKVTLAQSMFCAAIALYILSRFLIGFDISQFRLTKDGICVRTYGRGKIFPAQELRTALVFREYEEQHLNQYNVIVFSTLSLQQLAEKQENLMKKHIGGKKKLSAFKRIPGWEKHLAYRYGRNVLLRKGVGVSGCDCMLHSDQREQTLRELYPHLQWFQMTDEFEVIL